MEVAATVVCLAGFALAVSLAIREERRRKREYARSLSDIIERHYRARVVD